MTKQINVATGKQIVIPTGTQIVIGGIPWTPAEITTLGWWDASDTDSITDDTGSVSQINDLSGNNEHMTQATGSAQPTTNSRTITGLNVLDHDGSDHMSNASFPAPASDDMAFFMVAVIDSIDGQADSLYVMDGNADFQLASNNASQFNGQINTNAGSDRSFTNGPFTGPSIFNSNFDKTGNNISGYVDGTKETTDTAYNTGLGTGRLGMFENRGEAQFPDGAMAEFVIIEDMTTATRQKMEGYLAWKWGIEANLPEGHPYENAPPYV
jgi:hypothetical protein